MNGWEGTYQAYVCESLDEHMVTQVTSVVLTILSNSTPSRLHLFKSSYSASVSVWNSPIAVFSDIAGPSWRMDPKAFTSPLKMWGRIKVETLLTANTLVGELWWWWIALESVIIFVDLWRYLEMSWSVKEKKICYKAAMLPAIEMYSVLSDSDSYNFNLLFLPYLFLLLAQVFTPCRHDLNTASFSVRIILHTLCVCLESFRF